MPAAPSVDRLSEDLVAVCRRLYARGLVGGSEGNVSARIDGARILTTPAGACKGFLAPGDLVVVDPDGRPVGGGRPSTELKMHLQIYALRPDVQAVVHAHPPTATGFAIAGRGLDECVTPEVIATLGSVPVAPYGTPSTDELPDAIAPFVATHDALLLANHGAVTYGATLERAVNAMESIEQAARSLLVAHMLGSVRRLSREEADRLVALGAPRNPGCAIVDPTPLAARGSGAAGDDDLRAGIAAIVRDALGGPRP